LPGVFHPAFFFSTEFLLSFLQKQPLTGKHMLEMGSGNGLIAFDMSKRAASVVAVELSNTAIQGLLLNAKSNEQHIPNNVLQIVHSDLFDAVKCFPFDIIVVNPPYFPNKVNTETELAWNCGQDFEYFKKFFTQVGNYMHDQGQIIMVLSDLCNINNIKNIASSNGYCANMLLKKNFIIEDNFIFQFKKM
jgi:release factor glutamine methyltransferase